jgi:hypothetical protein
MATEIEKAAEWDRQWAEKNSRVDDPTVDRVFAVVGLAIGAFGTVLGTALIFISGYAAAGAMVSSGWLAASWGSYSRSDQIGKVAFRFGLVLSIVGVVVLLANGFASLSSLAAQVKSAR